MKTERHAIWVKPTVVVSKCLEFDACRYNGDKLKDEVVKLLKEYVRFIPVCPEVEIGLGIPRNTIRLVNTNKGTHLMEPKTGDDHTYKMELFAKTFARENHEIDGFILKSKSPSCGIYGVKVYSKLKKSSTMFTRSGVFALNMKSAFPQIPIEEEGRLTNSEIRRHFFTSIFTIAEFRRMMSQGIDAKSIIKFHTRHKYLFMMYNQKAMREMGRLLGQMEAKKMNQIAYLYFENILRIFKRMPSKKSTTNVLMHIFGYFSKKLSKSERDHFLSLLNDYKNKFTSINILNGILSSWIKRFDERYLRQQSFFTPFPAQLIIPLDSAKGRVIKN